jgi:hypothetical protein
MNILIKYLDIIYPYLKSNFKKRKDKMNEYLHFNLGHQNKLVILSFGEYLVIRRGLFK